MTGADGATERTARIGIERLLLGVSVVLPAVVAVLHATNVADAAHDDGAVRALGLGWTGWAHGLDAPLAAPWMALPIGSRAFRAALGGAALLGAAGAVIHRVTRALLAACAAERDAGTAGAVVAAIATCTAVGSAPWLSEGTSVAGAMMPAFLAWAALAIAVEADGAIAGAVDARPAPTRLVVAAFVIGLALADDPLAGGAALAALIVATAVASAVARRRSPDEARAAHAGGARVVAAVGLGALIAALLSAGRALPAGALFALAPRASFAAGALAMSTAPPLAPSDAPIGVLALGRADVGVVVGVLAAAGVAIAALVPRARALLAGVLVLGAVGALGVAARAPIGPGRYAPAALLFVGACATCAAVSLHAVVRAVARAPLRFAPVSAGLVALLEAAIPARALDDATSRLSPRATEPALAWDDVAWGDLPPRTILLTTGSRTLARVLASRASGELRDDVAFVPLNDLVGPLAMRELSREPALAPVWRDLALLREPGEWSLSSLASLRPLSLTFEPTWDRTLARHLVFARLVASFEPEPRGSSDRRRALDEFAPARDRLLASLASRDPALVATTIELLRARAVALAAAGEHDLVAAALEDLRRVAPDDPFAAQLVRRILATHGAIDVHDLAP